MKLLRPWGCFCGLILLILAAGTACGQNIFLNFNESNTFTPNFIQDREGIALSWSATAGIADEDGTPGGGVVSTGAGQVTVEPAGPETVSLDTGLSYTFSEYVQVNSFGATGDTVLALTLGEKSLLRNDGRGITCVLANLDGTHFRVEFIYRNPTSSSSGPFPVPDFQAELGHWFRLTFTITETVVAAGHFAVTATVADSGANGETSAQTPVTETYTFTDALLSGTTTANWVPIWQTSIGGNAFDNFAVGITDQNLGGVVASKGDPAPGVANAVFSMIGDPAVGKSGEVAFRAVLSGVGKDSGISPANDTGIWLYSGATHTLIAQTGKTSVPAPGTHGAAFAKLSDPLSSNATLGFSATLIPGVGDATNKNDAGVWTQTTAGLGLYVRKGDAAPGFQGATIGAISQFALEESGAAAIRGTASGSHLNSSNDTCFWLPDGKDVLQLVYQAPQHPRAFIPQKLVSGQTRSLDVVNGHGAAVLSSEGATLIGLSTPKGAGESGFTATTAIAVGNAAPGLTGPTIKSFGLPAVNAVGAVAFTFVMEGADVNASNNTGIGFLPRGGTASLLARTGNPAPGTNGAVFSALSAPVLCNTTTGSGAVAFVGRLKPGIGDTEKNGSNAQGIWSNINGSMQLIVRQGESTFQGGSYASFNQIALTDLGTIIFEAKLSGVPAFANQAIGYYGGPGDLFVAASTGPLVQVGPTMKTIKSLNIFPIAPASMGQTRSFDPASADFVYTVTYTDDTWALFAVHFS